MSLNATTRSSGSVTIIDLDGRITLGRGTEVLRDIVRKEAEANPKLILNLGKVTYIDSAGLGELVGAHAHLEKRNGAIKLLNVQQRLQDLLQITRLYTLFEAFDNETVAVRSFGDAARA